ncbi:MAG: aspartate carbamoyltransferase catalytic subunit [Dehalococcoidia bacterium]|nr:aspartate carbamoyltransferase catalytic subunit [Dehalococcoidia bacterium]
MQGRSKEVESRATPAESITPPTEGSNGASVRKVWQHRHLLDLDTLSMDELELLLKTAETMQGVLQRDVKKVPTLRGRVIITLFYEASTRTRMGFEMAGKLLSADVINITVGSSSVVKGETLLDTILTLQASTADVIVIRHGDSGAPYMAARVLTHTSVVNAGDGAHAHPTQGLLDLFTVQKQLGSLTGRKIVLVGDIAYSRVARSDLWGFTRMGAQVVLCAPPTLLPWDLLNGRTECQGHPFSSVEIEPDLRKAARDADVVMALRLQQERQQAERIPSLREYARYWQVNEEVLSLAKPNALVMHPGPMNEGVEISSSVAHGAQSVVEQQVSNGLAVRMAVLYLLGAPREQ